MPSFVPSKLIEFNYPTPDKLEHSPYLDVPQFTNTQRPVQEDTTPLLHEKDQKRIQKIFGSFLFYRQAIDLTILKSLNTLATQKFPQLKLTVKISNNS